MNILVLIDKFKNSLSSIQLSKIIKSTIKKHNVDYFPISDGGDGFLDSINYNKKFQKRYVYVNNPLGKKIKVMYLMDNENVYIEVAKIIGYKTVKKLDILNASTFGVGQVILDAINNGGKNFYIGLGGSVTNDGGIGMLNALGYNFNEKVTISPIEYSKYNFNIISDVNNPLLGDNGATFVFSKQKGATKKDIIILENRLKDYSKMITSFLNKDYSNMKGSGAAGGLGFAFLSILNAKYISGIDYILNYLKIDDIIDKYDIIITGEGKVDKQSLNGKIVFEILNRYNKKTLILCGVSEVNQNNIYSIVPNITNIKNSLNHPKYYFKKLVKSIKF